MGSRYGAVPSPDGWPFHIGHPRGSGRLTAYWMLVGGFTCSIRSLSHSPSATRMALAS